MEYFGWNFDHILLLFKYDGKRFQQLAMSQRDHWKLRYVNNTVQVGYDFYGLTIEFKNDENSTALLKLFKFIEPKKIGESEQISVSATIKTLSTL